MINACCIQFAIPRVADAGAADYSHRRGETADKGNISSGANCRSAQSGPRRHPLAPCRQPSSLLDTRVVYCGDCLEQLRKLPDACADLIYIDPPFNSNRNYEVFWGETKEKRAFDDRHASTQAYIDYMRRRCVQLTLVL